MKTPDLQELNRSIHIKNEEFCLKKYPEFTKFLMQLYPDCNHIERLYRYFHKDWNNTCKNCGRHTKFISFSKGYYKYCSPGCASRDNDVKKQKKITTLKHYGVENPSQSKDVILKKKNTLQVKYGDENYNNRERAKQTCLERYGDEKFNNIEKSKQTCLERYGTEYFLSDASVISRINETCKKKYGGRGNASKILKNKMKNTYSVLIEDEPVKNCIVSAKMDNLSVLPSNIELAGAEIELVSMVAREFILKNSLESIKDEYDYIIIDCPP
jgi:hypothetical protein